MLYISRLKEQNKMSSLPAKTQTSLRAGEVAMKKHLENLKNTLGREVEFVLDADVAAIHTMAVPRYMADNWPEIIYGESLYEIVRGIIHCATYKKNPRLKSAILATFTGNKIIFRIPSVNSPDGRTSVKYSFEDGNLVCSRGSEFNYNLEELAAPKYFESALEDHMTLDVSGATSEADVEKLWIEAVNDVAKRKDFNDALQKPLEQLLKKGVKVDLPKFGDLGQLTAANFLLNHWKGESNLHCIDFFVNKGADVYGLIETATYHSRAHLFRLLKRPDVDVNHQDVNGKTFLHYAAEEFEDPKLIKEVKKDLSTEEIWVNPAKQFLAWKSDNMHEYYDTFFTGLKQFPSVDVTIKDKNGRTALDLARKMNNIWILPGLEKYCNSKLPKSAPSQPVAGAVKKVPVGKPQSPAATKFGNGQVVSGPAKLPKELLTLLDVMYRTIKQSASDTTDLELEYEKFIKVFNKH